MSAANDDHVVVHVGCRLPNETRAGGGVLRTQVQRPAVREQSRASTGRQNSTL
jgi:hypothetical protein